MIVRRGEFEIVKLGDEQRLQLPDGDVLYLRTIGDRVIVSTVRDGVIWPAFQVPEEMRDFIGRWFKREPLPDTNPWDVDAERGGEG